jgi:2-iminobutanoate/2-iminopropanoate deaminase
VPYAAVTSEAVFDTPAPMSQATLTQGTRLLHISGQTPQDARGETVHAGDIEGQTARALENIKALVEKAGGSLADVCRIVVYITRREHLKSVMEVRRRVLPEPYPATTAVVVAGLANPDWLVEIEATAVLN